MRVVKSRKFTELANEHPFVVECFTPFSDRHKNICDCQYFVQQANAQRGWCQYRTSGHCICTHEKVNDDEMRKLVSEVIEYCPQGIIDMALDGKL